MLVISGFENYAEYAVGDVAVLAGALVVNGNNVAAKVCNKLGNISQLTGLVLELDSERVGAAGLEQTALDDARKDSNVDVAARNKTNDLFALYGNFVKHYRRNRNRARTLCDKLMLLDQCEDSRGNLVVANGNNVVNVLLAKLESAVF